MLSDKVDIKKASAYYFAGTIFNNGIGFITVPIFTRILTVDDYGVVTTYNSWVAITTMITSLALYMAVRAAFVDYKNKIKEFLSTAITFTFLYGVFLLGLIVIIIYFARINISFVLVILCLLQAIGSALIEEYSMYLMMTYRFRFRTLLMICPSLLSTIIAVILIINLDCQQSYIGRIIPSSFVTLIFGLLVMALTFFKAKPRINLEYLRYGLAISVPLVLHGIALNILSQADRMMITIYRGAYETGIYGLIYNFSMIATVLTTALEGVWIPWFTQKMVEKNSSKISEYAKHYIYTITVALLCIVLIGPEVVHFLATEEYREGINIIPPLVISNFIVFSYTFFVNIEHFYKKTIIISINTCIAAASNIVMNAVLIPIYGYVGAAYSTLLSYLLAFFLHVLYAIRLNKTIFRYQLFIVPFLLMLLVTMIFYIFIEFWVIRWGIAILAIVVLFIANRKFIIRLLNRK